MKKLLSIAVAALLMCVAACQSGGYKVTGTATGAEDGDTVILADFLSMFEIDTLQVSVVKDGKFVFEGVRDSATMCYVLWSSAKNPDLSVATQIALENANITVKLDTASTAVAEVSGTPANEALTQLNRKENDINNQGMKAFNILSDTTQTAEAHAQAEQQLNGLQEQMMTLYKEFVKANITNIAGVSRLAQYASIFEDSEVNEFLDAVPANLENESIKTLRDIYQVKAKTAVGQPFKDIKAKTPEDTELSVSECAAKAKVLMIDFWASWCGPCRAEMPNVKAAYERYHAQGFDIIGVSLDNDAEAWKKAISDLGMVWPQISDLKGWDCEGAATYGVRAIPATVLIKDGKIVARDVRGEKLAPKVAELLGE